MLPDGPQVSEGLGRAVWPELRTWVWMQGDHDTGELTLLGRNQGQTVLVSFIRFTVTFLVQKDKLQNLVKCRLG